MPELFADNNAKKNEKRGEAANNSERKMAKAKFDPGPTRVRPRSRLGPVRVPKVMGINIIFVAWVRPRSDPGPARVPKVKGNNDIFVTWVQPGSYPGPARVAHIASQPHPLLDCVPLSMRLGGFIT